MAKIAIFTRALSVSGIAMSCALSVEAQCYSITDAVFHARDISPQVASANYLVKQGEYTVQGLKSQKRPQVSAFLRSGVGDGSLQTAQRDNQYGVEMSYRLYDFGRSRFELKSAQSEAEASKSNVDRLERAISDELLRALIQLQYADALKLIYEERLSVLRTRLEKADKQLEQKTITIMDHSRLYSEVATTSYELTEARAQSESALLLVRQLLRDDLACVNIEELATFISVNRVIDVDELLEQLPLNAEWLEMQKRVEAASYESRSVARNWLPEVSASAFSSQTYNDTTDRFEDRDRLGIQVSAPLYDGGVRRSETNRARARLNQLEYEQQAFQEQLKAQKLTSWTSYVLMEDSVKSLKSALESAEAHVEAVRRRYELRAGTVDELLLAEERLMDLKLRYQRVLAEYQIISLDLLREDSFQ